MQSKVTAKHPVLRSRQPAVKFDALCFTALHATGIATALICINIKAPPHFLPPFLPPSYVPQALPAANVLTCIPSNLIFLIPSFLPTQALPAANVLTSIFRNLIYIYIYIMSLPSFITMCLRHYQPPMSSHALLIVAVKKFLPSSRHRHCQPPMSSLAYFAI